MAPDDEHTIEQVESLIALYEAWGNPDGANEWRAKLDEITKGAAGEESSQTED